MKLELGTWNPVVVLSGLGSCRCLLVVGGCWLPWVVWRWRHSVAVLRQWVSRLKIDFATWVTSSWTPIGLKSPRGKISGFVRLCSFLVALMCCYLLEFVVGWCWLWWQCGGEVVGPCWLLLVGLVIYYCGLSLSGPVGLRCVRAAVSLLVVGVGCRGLFGVGVTRLLLFVSWRVG